MYNLYRFYWLVFFYLFFNFLLLLVLPIFVLIYFLYYDETVTICDCVGNYLWNNWFQYAVSSYLDIIEDMHVFVLYFETVGLIPSCAELFSNNKVIYILKILNFFFFDIYFNSISISNIIEYSYFCETFVLINILIFFFLLNLFIIFINIYRLYFAYSRRYRIFHRFLVGWYAGIAWIPLLAYFQFHPFIIFILIYFLSNSLLSIPNSWSYTLLLIFTILLVYTYLFMFYIYIFIYL